MSEEATQEPAQQQGYICPSCGESDWRAEYYEAAYQDVLLVAGEDGRPEIADWGVGAYGHYDGDTENEALKCNNCEHRIVLGTFTFVPTEGEPG